MQRFLIFSWLVLMAAPLKAQTAADLFNGALLQEIRLDVHPKDWQQLTATFLENTYYAADVHWLYNGRYVTAEQAAIRSRGTGSRHPVKPGLRVDFNRYNAEYRFLGLRSLTLRNNVQDASMLHERMAFDLMRRLGVPAPRTAHVRLYVNNQYMGLYLAVESIDEEYIQDRFNDEDGFLYEYDYGGNYGIPYFFEYRGADPALYLPLPFQPETHKNNPEGDRIVDWIRFANQASDQEFEARIGDLVDVRSLFTELAAEAYLAEQDGIVGDFGMNNFYLFRAADGNRFHFIPWDKSQTFVSLDRPVLAHINGNVLTRRAFAIPAVRDMFKGALLNASFTAGAAGGWMEQEILRAYEQIREAARQDLNKQCFDAGFAVVPCSNEEFEAGINQMLRFVRDRKSVIDKYLFDASGTPNSIGFQPFAIADRGGVVYTSTKALGSTRTGHGYIEPTSGSAAASGLAILSFKRGNEVVAETAMPASRLLRAGRISAQIKGPVTTGIAIANPNSRPVAVTFFFTNEEGRDFGHGSAVIAPEGQIAGFLDKPPFSGGSEIQGTFSFNASLPVGVLALRGFFNERSDFLSSATPVGSLFGESREHELVPYFVHSSDWNTEVTLVNTEDAVNNGTIEFNTKGGVLSQAYSIPPRSAVRMNPTPSSAGFVRVQSEGDAPVIGVLLSQKRGTTTVNETLAPSVQASTAFRMYVQKSAAMNSSIVLANSQAADSQVRLEMTSLAGNSMGISGTLTLPAGAQTVAVLQEIPGLETLPETFQGVLRISSSSPVHGLGFRTRINGRGDALTIAVPPAAEDAPTAGLLSFPHMVVSGGYETRLVLIGTNPGRSVAGTFRYRNDFGDLIDLGLE